jgi:copper-binding protein NosD
LTVNKKSVACEPSSLVLRGVLTDYLPDLNVEGVMKMLPASVVLLVFLFSRIAQAATTTVTATGNCPADPADVQTAINSAAPGDTIQLLPGPSGLAFNFTCLSASDSIGVTISSVDITLVGAPGLTAIQGPGVGATFFNSGIVVLSDGVTIKSLDFQGFDFAVLVTSATFTTTAVGPANVSVLGCHFESNSFAVLSLSASDHLRLVQNTATVPPGVGSDPFAPFAVNFGFVIEPQSNDLLVADNTIQGPGPTGLLTSISQLLTSPSLFPEARTTGILQVDNFIPASVRGRVSGNILNGLDAGLQSSSNFGVVTGNTASNCAIGLVISNDTDDGVTQVTDNIVAQNISSGNQIGLWVASGARNSVVLNDFSNSSLVGLLFLQNVNGAPSRDNAFLLNKGSMQGVPGNQGAGVCKVLNLCK